MFNRMLSALAAAALTTGLFALTSPAQAAPGDDAVTVTVSLEGLDPADPADSDRIDRRIRSAARDLCGSGLIQPLRLMQSAAACEKAAVANAKGAVEIASARRGSPFRLSLRAN